MGYPVNCDKKRKKSSPKERKYRLVSSPEYMSWQIKEKSKNVDIISWLGEKIHKSNQKRCGNQKSFFSVQP
jgi:hypothetical protein